MIFIYAFIAVALFLLLMSLGVIFAGKRLQGSCGGLGQIMGDACSICGKKDECERQKQSEVIAIIES